MHTAAHKNRHILLALAVYIKSMPLNFVRKCAEELQRRALFKALHYCAGKFALGSTLVSRFLECYNEIGY